MTRYFLQTASFRTVRQAETEIQRLRNYGAFIEEANISGNKWFRIYLGPYPDWKAARAAGLRLKRARIISAFQTIKKESKQETNAGGEKRQAAGSQTADTVPLALPTIPDIPVEKTKDPPVPQPAGTPDNIQSTVSVSEYGQVSPADKQKALLNLSPGKIEELDSKLSDALILYYDGQFGQALPLFNEIAAEAQTMDILWWIGTSALKTGDLKLAVEKFQKMLSANPQLMRVRLELASAYFNMGQYEDAKKELEIVKASNPPEEVLKNIAKLSGTIDDKSKKVFANIRFSEGLQWDSNISSGPVQKQLNVTGGTLSLSTESQKLSDWASITTLSGNVLYKLWESQGLMWNSTLDFYRSTYFSHTKFNYQLADVTTGPWWAGRQDILKLPVGFSDQRYGSERLSFIYHFDPSYEHYFNQHVSLRGSFNLIKENFDANKNSALDNTTRRYEISPNFFFDNRRHIISLGVGYETLDAGLERNSYKASYYTLSYFTRFPTNTELFFKYQGAIKNYNDPPLLYTEKRVDRRHTLSAVVSQEFYKNFFASFAFNYIDNNSNTELYDFDKQTYTLSVGCHF